MKGKNKTDYKNKNLKIYSNSVGKSRKKPHLCTPSRKESDTYNTGLKSSILEQQTT